MSETANPEFESANGVYDSVDQVTGFHYGRDENGNYLVLDLQTGTADFGESLEAAIASLKKGVALYHKAVNEHSFDRSEEEVNNATGE